MNDEPISNIAELNVLQQKVLRGEEIPPEEYLRVLQLVKKLRRQKADPVEKPKTSKGKVNLDAILSTPAPRDNTEEV